MVRKKTINNLIFLSFFTIYIPIIPGGPETQPILTVILCLIMAVTNFKPVKHEAWLYLGVLFLAANFLLFSTKSVNSIIALLSYLLAPLFFVTNRTVLTSINKKFPVYLTYLFFVSGVSTIIWIPLISDTVVYINGLLPRSSTNTLFSLRGFSFFTPEPSYSMFFFVLLLVANDALAFQNKISAKKRNWLTTMILISALISKSIYCLGVILIYILTTQFKKNKKWSVKPIITTFSILVTLYLFVVTFNESRVSKLINKLISTDYSNISLLNLLTIDSSFASRIISNTISYLSPLHFPFGVGLGQAQNRLYEVIIDLKYGWVFQNIDVFYNNSSYKPQTYFSNLTLETGVFSFPFLFFFIKTIFKRKNNISKIALRPILIVMLFLVQGQLSNPIIWILFSYFAYESQNLNKGFLSVKN